MPEPIQRGSLVPSPPLQASPSRPVPLSLDFAFTSNIAFVFERRWIHGHASFQSNNSEHAPCTKSDFFACCSSGSRLVLVGDPVPYEDAFKSLFLVSPDSRMVSFLAGNQNQN